MSKDDMPSSSGNPNDDVTCKRGDLDRMCHAAVKAALAPVKSKQQTGYYSTVRFALSLSGAGPFTYTLAPGTRVAFGYALGTQLGPAQGYLAPGPVATLRHTNLSDQGKTRDGETYYVQGIALALAPQSDGFLADYVWSNAWTQLAMNSGTNTWPLGPLFFYPAIAGLNGAMTSLLGAVPPPLQEAQTIVRAYDNGMDKSELNDEVQAPCLRFTEPLIWCPSGTTDASLNFNIATDNPATFSVSDRAAAAGVQAFTHPAEGDPGTFVDITVRLVGYSISDPSVNR